MSDPVSKPSHYLRGGFELMDVIDAWNLNFRRANVAKYLFRAGWKDPAKELEDLRKAQTYLDREIASLEKKQQAREFDVSDEVAP